MIKEYRIWLKSGGAIAGTAKEEELTGLLENIKAIDGRLYVPYQMPTTEGCICVNPSDIEAIAINDIYEKFPQKPNASWNKERR